MKGSPVVGIVLLLVALAGIIGGGFLVWRGLRSMQLEGTTDEAKLKGTVRGALDSWLGYAVLDSSELKKRMRAEGYRMEWTDDGANYAERFKGLADGKYDVVVATVDSYVLGAKEHGYPGLIVAVLDESKGDAIIAKESVKDVNGLDDPAVKIAFTPASPSEFLLKSMGSHFGLKKVRTPGPWRVETGGSEEAFKLLKEGKVDAAVLWEPDVTAAKSLPGFHYLMGSDKSRRLIVDILVVRQEYLASNPEIVETLLREYFLALKSYRDEPAKLVEDLVARTKRPEEVLRTALSGVAFASFAENCEDWMGVPLEEGGRSDEGLVETIEATIQVFTDGGELSGNPLPSGNPYAIVNSKLLAAQKGRLAPGAPVFEGSNVKAPPPRAADVAPMDDAGWAALRKIGALKPRPIVFQSGTSILTPEGKGSIDETVARMKHYPSFRLLVRGHTSPGGDEQENRTLSQDRAEAVARYLELVHGVDVDAVRAEGKGSTEPLPRDPSEGDRAYRYRLPRVEFVLLSEVI